MKLGAGLISRSALAVASGLEAQVPPDPRVGLHGAPPDAWRMVLEPPCLTPDERAQPWEAHCWRPANNERDVESPEAATVLWDSLRSAADSLWWAPELPVELFGRALIHTKAGVREPAIESARTGVKLNDGCGGVAKG